MSAKLELTQVAEADFNKLIDYGVANFGEKAASDYAEKIRSRLRDICAFPESFPEDADLQPALRVSPLLSHIILYLYDGATVTVLTICHHSKDWRKTTSGNS